MSGTVDHAAPDLELREAVAAVRSHWRRRRLLEGAPALIAAAIVAILAGLAFRSALGSPSAIVITTRVVGYSILAGVAFGFLVLPAMRRANDEQVALYVEEQAPELRQLFVSAVYEMDQPVSDGSSPALKRRVIEHAVAELRRLEQGALIERPRARRAVIRLASLTGAAALLVMLGPTAVRDIARILFVPWSHAAAATVPALSVAPGNVSIPRGAALDVRAELHSLADHGAEIVLRADSSAEWTRIPMVRDSTGVGYVARVFDINKNATYYVDAGTIRSPEYRITVTDLPTVKQLALELRYPAYTGLPPQKIENGGDVVAVTGTTAALTITSTLPVTAGSLHFDDGTTVPLALDEAGRVSGSFRVLHDGFYRIDLVASDGTKVPGTIQHSVEALVDHPPQIRIEKPGRDTRVTSVEEVPVSLRASDDYGVHGVQLHYSVNGGPDRVIALADSARRGSVDFRAVHTLFLEEMSLKVGDLVAYHATARDGAGNTASSDIYFMEVRPFGLNYRAAEDDGGGGGGGGGGGNDPGKFTVRQRQLIAGTFNWRRDSARTSERDRRANAATLAIAQGKLRTDVAAQMNQMIARGVAQQDTLFALITAELDSAAKDMKPAEDGLGRLVLGDAIPAQERALQHLQAADDAFRDITVRRQNGGGGGGGGGGGAAQDLADLFELQTDKLKNQYETPRSEASSTPAQQAIDSTQEKLKELAARQLQENERQQRAAEAMQQRLGQQLGRQGGQQQGQQGGQQQRQQGGQQQGQQGGQQQGQQTRGQQLSRPTGGGAMGSSQRELARQTEEQARQLEKLSREQNSPELADAARKLQEAADAMRQAAAGSSQQASTALDRLRQASRNVAGAQTSAQGQAIQDLARRASDLAQQQQGIAKDAAALQTLTPNERDQRAGTIDQRKDALANAVRQLGTDAERTAQQVRGDQPAAAAAAQTAADDMRNRRVLEQIDASKRVMRDGTPDYSRRLESVIGETLDTVAGRLATAAGSVGARRDQQQAAALDRTRDLVRDLESLMNRTGGQQGGEQQGRQGGQQQGQQGGEQQGRQGGQQQGRQGGQQQGQQGGEQQGRQGGQQQGQQGGQQPGQMGGGAGRIASGSRIGDPRQFRAEVAARRDAAEALRRDLSRQGVDVTELDHVIGQLQRLQGSTDPGRTEELQAGIVASLKNFEFDVWRQLNSDTGNKPALGAAAQVPPQYRAMVEEYYRSLARKGPR
jgi:hypothetical protein